MICPYCDSRITDLPDNHVCPHCGGPLKEEKAEDNQLGPDLGYYYNRYQPDRMQAVMALRIDTGMGPLQAQQMIDLIFDFYDSRTGEKDQAEQNESDTVLCPKCSSGSITVREARSRWPYFMGFYRTPEIRLAASVIRLAHTISNLKNGDKLECVCMKCGYVWQVEQE